MSYPYHVITLRQPYAAAIVMETIPGVDLIRQAKFRGRLLIHAVEGRVLQADLIRYRLCDGELVRAHNKIIGFIDVERPTHIDDCQLLGCVGPHILLTRTGSARIFQPFLEYFGHSPSGPVELTAVGQCAAIDEAIHSDRLLKPAEYNSLPSYTKVSSDDVGGGGWTYD